MQQLPSQELNRVFGDVVEQSQFIKDTGSLLNKKGFQKQNTLPLVCVCRDELATPLLSDIDREWRSPELPNHSNIFNLGSLAGMVLSGKTGFSAALSHAPEDKDGVHRFVFYSFPHIGFNEKGEVGTVKRVALSDQATTCCGALCGIKSQLDSGNFDTAVDIGDLELSVIKQRLLSAMDTPKSQNLTELTKLATEVALKDAEKAIDAALAASSPKKFEYAVISGVQIHGPGPKPENYIWPNVGYLVTGDQKREALVWK